MTIDRYTKVVLTIIAFALIWIAAQQSVSTAVAARKEPMAVFVAQISSDAAGCIAGHVNFFKGNTGPCIAGW